MSAVMWAAPSLRLREKQILRFLEEGSIPGQLGRSQMRFLPSIGNAILGTRRRSTRYC